MYGVATDDNGLYYMRARYYNVSIKRFINQDVVNGSITNSQSLNKFSYVQGNPIKLTDPFGLSPNISLPGIGHAALNLLGIIPGLDFCDAINAAWYFAEGDYANAALCTVAVIPFLGSVAGTGIKWGMKAGTKAEKVAETVKLGSRIAGGAGGFIISRAQALEATKNIHANSGKNGDKSNWSNTADYLTLGLSIVGMGLAGASIAKSGGALKSLWKGQSVVESVAVSNTTKRVVSESGKGIYLKMNLQFFAESGIKTPIEGTSIYGDRSYYSCGKRIIEGVDPRTLKVGDQQALDSIRLNNQRSLIKKDIERKTLIQVTRVLKDLEL